MAILSNGKFYGFLCSAKETGQKLANGVKEYVEDFVSGFAGHGWKIWEYVKGKWMLEIDSIRVRGQFTVFEMLISKVRAIIGAQAITQGCGKIKTAELSEDGTAYLITLEDAEMSFMEHDFIRCQEFTGSQKVYHVEIESVTDGIIRVPLSEFNLDEEGIVLNPPTPGDDIVQFGNSSHDEKYVGRHSAIYMHADETGQPAIDVLDEIYSKYMSDCLKARFGGDIPGGDGARGFYSVNGMIKGVDKSGHTTYCLYPDGTAELGDKSALFKPDKSGHIAGGAIAWVWNEKEKRCVVSMDDVQVEWNNVKDSPEWINEWTKEGTTIGNKFVAAPTGFFGKQDPETRELTGILMGDEVMVDGVKRTGIFALVDNKPVFELDPITRKYKFTGEVNADTGTFNGTVNADKGSIGGFEIASGRIGSEVNTEYGGGQLAIYNNLIRVGNSDSYSLLGGDTIPSIAGGAYTSTCRFTNNTKNDLYGNSANYGMMINVSGAERNYGIKSDAPIVATSCIGMKTASYITFVNGKADNSMDFSRYNVFLLGASPSNIGLNLPTESTVASYFGLTSLPGDFSVMFTLHIRPWSYDITINNVYDWNANLINVTMVKGDTLTLLISKYDGFRYDVLNRQD